MPELKTVGSSPSSAAASCAAVDAPLVVAAAADSAPGASEAEVASQTSAAHSP